jgi:hypothetical protein
MFKLSDLFTIINRLFCSMMYVFPFLELYLFFNPLMRSYRIAPAWLENAAIVYRANVWMSFTIFAFIIAITTIRSIKLNYYSRYNLTQVLMILFTTNLLDTLDFLFPYVIRGQGSIVAPFFYFLCFAQMLLICYCAIYSIIGKIPNIPVLTEAVKMNIEDYL